MGIPLLPYSRPYRLATVLRFMAASNSQLTNKSNSSESHITTDGQLAGQSWFQAPSGAQDQIFVTVRLLSSSYSLSTDRIENTASDSSIVACVSVATYTCLSSPYQAIAVFVSHHVTISLLTS
jgi:hypothetical protein